MGRPGIGAARDSRRILPAVSRSEGVSLALVVGFVLLVLSGGPFGPTTGTGNGGSAALGGRPADELDRRIGQMLVFGFSGAAPSDPGLDRLRAEIRAGLVGGVVLLPRNIGPRRRLTSLVSSLQAERPILPLLVAADQEGGKVQRLGARQGYAGIPGAEEIARGDPGAARAIYGRMADELQGVGINLNLGPVVDLAVNGRNPVIARLGRSYGSDGTRVTAFARTFIEAHAAAGILTALKHFPGHGSSSGDSHHGPVDVSNSWVEAELEPYAALTAASEPPIVMTGHLAHRELTGGPALPASLSRVAIEDRLRGRLGFQGVVMTDDLAMGAIRSRYTLEEAAVEAILAGNDLLLFASDEGATAAFRVRIRQVIRRAVLEGRIPRSRIDASYQRIRALKHRLVPKAVVLGG